MDINDQNTPRPEGGAGGAGDNAKPRDGKRPQGRNHHRRPNRGHGDRPQADRPNSQQPAQQVAQPGNQPNQLSANTQSAPAAPRAQATENRQYGRNDRKKAGGNGRPERRADQAVADKTDADKAIEENRAGDNRESGRQNAPRPSGSRPSAGRPQRTTRHAAQQADLPDMNHLLIDDAMNAAETVARPEEVSDADEIERILARDLLICRKEPIPEVVPEDKVVIVGIRFRTGGKTYFFDPGQLTCRVGEYAVVETARGQEFGEVCIANRLYDRDKLEHTLSPVLRIATEEDIRHSEENREREDAAFRVGVQKIAEHGLDMKLVSVQYTFDNSKLLFYFTSAKRVDFRDLVKDLAGVFHIRIELRQIGIRDEARMIGGLGACGRPLCCNTFLNDFGQVSMKMAKEQNLSLNSSKISGCCGRLMCCLRYEYETYAEEIRRTPAAGTFVNTPDGPGVVTEVFPLQGDVKVSLRGQTDSAPKRYSRDVVELQHRPRSESVSVSETPSTDESAEPAEEAETIE